MTFYDVPSLQVHNFVERKTSLNRLKDLFECSATRSIVVLIGMGGAGKTQLALKYCRLMKGSGRYRAIFWLDASSRNALYRAMEIIAKQLSPGLELDNPGASVSLVKDVLSNWSDAWLMVFDNLDNPSDLQYVSDFFPDNPCSSILVTSRYAGSRELEHPIEVDSMDEEEGLQLLLGNSVPGPEELTAAKQILTTLGYLPLAIDQTRAYISRRRLRLRDFLDDYDKRKQSIMKETPRFWQYRRTLPDTEEETYLSLWTTWDMSLSLLGVGEEDSSKLRDVLTMFSYFHPSNISEKLFSNGVDATINRPDVDLS